MRWDKIQEEDVVDGSSRAFSLAGGVTDQKQGSSWTERAAPADDAASAPV